MLSRKIANLTGLRLRLVARSDHATSVGIQMSLGTSAIAILGHGLVVDVVSKRTNRIVEATELDSDVNTLTTRAGSESQGASDTAPAIEFARVTIKQRLLAL